MTEEEKLIQWIVEAAISGDENANDEILKFAEQGCGNQQPRMIYCFDFAISIQLFSMLFVIY